MVSYSTKYLPENKVRYLMGVGDPLILLKELFAELIFLIVSYHKNCKTCECFTKYGKINLKNAKYKEDFTPLEETCDCYACKNLPKLILDI